MFQFQFWSWCRNSWQETDSFAEKINNLHFNSISSNQPKIFHSNHNYNHNGPYNYDLKPQQQSK